MIVNKKLNKQFKTILSSSESALVILKEEAEKIDERYKKLAELEKAEIAEQIKSLTSQIEMCKSALKMEPECPVPAEETAEVTAPADTLFPIDEPSEQEEDSKKEFETEGWTGAEGVAVAEETEDEGPTFDGAGFTEADNEVEGDDSADTEEESSDSEESEWPSDFPDDWNN